MGLSHPGGGDGPPGKFVVIRVKLWPVLVDVHKRNPLLPGSRELLPSRYTVPLELLG
jgi:hypothetical protein